MVEKVSHISSILGEGPIWDEKNNCMCWVDIRQGYIHLLNVDSHTQQTLSVGTLIGAIALDEKGNFLVAKEDGIGLIDRRGNPLQTEKLPKHNIPDFRFNDGKCDARGRFWIGGMSDKEKEGVGGLYCLDKHRKFTKKISGLTIPNGMAWSKDQQSFYFIDTPTRQVLSYTFNLEEGEISHPKTAFVVPEKEGFPDGMTIDEEGMLWIAHFGGGQVTRWDPEKGIKLLAVKLPVSQVTSCVFGGSQLTDLYITTAKKGLSAHELKKEPLAGHLFLYKNCGFKGLPAFRRKSLL